MHTIKINNFGPISDVELEIKDFLVFIGPQAGGKSTVSKAIFFFKSLRDDLIGYILESAENKNFDKPVDAFARVVRKKFPDFWGPTHHLENIFLEYTYKKDISITITLEKNGKYVNPVFSKAFKEGIREIAGEARRTINQKDRRDPKFLSSSELLAIESEKRVFYKTIEHQCAELFAEDKDLLFIPAGRSLLATLPDQLQYIHTQKLDYLMRAFLERMNHSKMLFDKNLDEMIILKEKLTRDAIGPIDRERVSIARAIINKILKGSYRFDREGEKLYIDDRKFIKLNFSSSGQQESLWILLVIFLAILESKRVFMVIEEPEAHLYPEAQKDMVELISLPANYTGNQVIITTHSPYILSSLNNLLYAGKVGKKFPGEVAGRINRNLWLNSGGGIGAYFIRDGRLWDIIDGDLGLIKAEAIDSASEMINEDFDFLFNLDD